MARVLLIHHDKGMRTLLETQIRRQHQVTTAKQVEAGVRELRGQAPEVILVGHDAQMQEGGRLLRYLKENNIRVPVVVVVSRGGGVYREMVTKLGAQGFIEYPADVDKLNGLLDQASRSSSGPAGTDSGPPPITDEELAGNLSMLESQMNQRMKCFAGKNLVFIHALIAGMKRSKPRICLKCPLRAEYGLNREVYYEFIRDVCCGDPLQCEAVQRFNADRKANL